MRKITGLFVLMVMVLLAGCSSASNNEEADETTASFDDIVMNIKEQVAEDLKEDGVEEEVMVDGDLAFFLETDLTASEDSDPSVSIWIENLGLNTEEIENGKVITAMMNVNADEFIVLEAKDEKQVDSLRESLEKELDNQDQTWSQYLPDQHEKVKNNLIVTKDKFLLYVTYDNPEKIEEVFKNSFE